VGGWGNMKRGKRKLERKSTKKENELNFMLKS
jgi:hypothetical protein